jgi:hypothetical protein
VAASSPTRPSCQSRVLTPTTVLIAPNARCGGLAIADALAMGSQVQQLDLGIDLALDRGPHREPSPGDNRQLTTWAARGQRARRGPSGRDRAGGGVRFAFYGRVSTLEYQDADSSFGWQRESASDVTTGRGRIVTEFFDVGYSRTVPWTKRPQAACPRDLNHLPQPADLQLHQYATVDGIRKCYRLLC